ncbi:MAG: hypothetical protein IJQ02_06125 [Oscillospiraceae bacterium]|nr:hypothetical protein [Oscillospiraceae bacterium]
MKNWQKKVPPYEGGEPYLYFAFAEEDSGRVWKLTRRLLERGCRIWYCCGPADSAEELLRRQERAAKAEMTLLYLSDAACGDRDTKTNVLVNQKLGRPILCLDPDGTDRRLSMGLHEDAPHVPLYRLPREEDAEDAVIHAEGFSQEMLGEAVTVKTGSVLKTLSVTLCVLAVLLLAAMLFGLRRLPQAQPEEADSVPFTDPVILAAVQEAVGGGAVTEEAAERITVLRLRDMPAGWEDLALLPALERIIVPQTAVGENSALPEGDVTVELSGGGA